MGFTIPAGRDLMPIPASALADEPDPGTKRPVINISMIILSKAL
jgi:hypothetical protein